jgi:hypothetical protein
MLPALFKRIHVDGSGHPGVGDLASDKSPGPERYGPDALRRSVTKFLEYALWCGARVTRNADSEGSGDASSPPRRAALWDRGAHLRPMRGAPWHPGVGGGRATA